MLGAGQTGGSLSRNGRRCNGRELDVQGVTTVHGRRYDSINRNLEVEEKASEETEVFLVAAKTTPL